MTQASSGLRPVGRVEYSGSKDFWRTMGRPRSMIDGACALSGVSGASLGELERWRRRSGGEGGGEWHWIGKVGDIGVRG